MRIGHEQDPLPIFTFIVHLSYWCTVIVTALEELPELGKFLSFKSFKGLIHDLVVDGDYTLVQD